MRNAAIDFGDDSNVINLSDMGDDLGMSLLANTTISRGDSPKTRDVHVSSSFNSGQDIQISSLEPLDAVSLDIPIGGGGYSSLDALPEITIDRSGGGERSGYGGERSGYGISSGFENSQSASGPGISLMQASRDPEADKREKIDLINKLTRLESKGFPISKRFTMDNSLEEIKVEFDRLVDAKQLEKSMKFQRQMMMGFCTGLELMNEKFNPFDWKLNGWSESIHENIEDFDEVFEELYDKYKDRGKMPPEARLIFMMVGSGFMFHMSNSFFRSKMPATDDILRNNPELARQFAAAAANSAGPGFGNFMNMAMPGGQQSGGPGQPAVFGGQAPAGAFYQAGSSTVPPVQMPQMMAAQEPPRVPRREMRGPSGVDDILKTFEEVRASDNMSFGAMNSGGMSDGIPIPAAMMMQNPGGQQIDMFGRPAAAAASELGSLHSDDLGSIAESTRTGGTRGGGQRRRKASTPIGASISLDV